MLVKRSFRVGATLVPIEPEMDRGAYIFRSARMSNQIVQSGDDAKNIIAMSKTADVALMVMGDCRFRDLSGLVLCSVAHSASCSVVTAT